MRLFAAVVATLLSVTAVSGSTKPEAALRKEAGNDFLKKRDYPRARDEYLAALKIDPSYEDAHYNLGVVYFFRLQDYPRALYHLTTYARLVKDAPDMGQVKSLAFQALEKIEEADRDSYARALGEGTAAALRDYMERRPQSSYLSDASDKLRRLEAYEEEVRTFNAGAESAFNRALAQGTPEAMAAYLADHPDSPRAQEAQRLRDRWLEDDKEYRTALGVGTVEVLERFASEHPQSPYAAQAKARIDRIKEADEAYQAASQAKSIPALQQFVRTYEDSPRAAEARRLLGNLEQAEAEAKAKAEAEAKAKADAEAKAKAAADAQARADAEAKTKAEAETRAQEQKKARAEADHAWTEAQRADNAGAYEAFARSHPQHPMASESARLAAALRAAAPATSLPLETPAAAAPPPAQTEVPAPAVSAETPTSPPVQAVAAPPPVPAGAAPQTPAAPRTPEEQLQADWKEARSKDTVESYEGFLGTHPAGDEAEAARRRLEELKTAGQGDALDREKKRALDKYRKMIQGK